MPRGTPPDHQDAGAFAGLRQRRRERGLPTGTIRACPECGAPEIEAEVTHWLDLPGEAMAPKQHPKGIAATHRCANGHEWIRDL